MLIDLETLCTPMVPSAERHRPVSALPVAPRPVAPVGAPSPRRAAPVETVPLPADTRRPLSGIVAQLRNVPRAIIGDPAEVVHFLGRTARALERLRDQPVVVTPKPAAVASRPIPALALPTAPRALSAREHAEAAFRAPANSTLAAAPVVTTAGALVVPITLPAPRMVTDRKGRGVRVEVRRARAAGQLEMPL